MTDTTENRFRTKTGYCHLLPDKVVLTRDGIVGDTAKIVVGNRMIFILLLYSLMSCFILYRAWICFIDEDYALGSLFTAIGLFWGWAVWQSRNNSAAPTIERKNIQSVTFKKGITGLTRSRFEVMFINEQGSLKRRLIILGGVMGGPTAEDEKAVKIFQKEGLIPA